MTLTGRQQAKMVRRADSRTLPPLLSAVRRAGLALCFVLAMPGWGVAQQTPGTVQDHPVVLELYTAQGCISCPPADDMMLELAPRDDVIALSLHVDYWDYIGWVDSFADPEYGQRQQRYARRHGQSTIYTPQVIINGIDIVEGFRVMQVMETIATHRRRPAEIQIDLTRVDGGGLEIRAHPLAPMAPVVAMASRRSAMPNAVVGTLSMGDASEEPAAAMAQTSAPSPGAYSVAIVRYRAQEEVEILDGENAGRTAVFANIVTSWQTAGAWDMSNALEMTVPLEGDDPVVVIVQEAGQGEIVAAARLR